MAFSDAIETVWRSAFETEYYQNNPYVTYAADASAQLRSGDKLVLPTDSTGYALTSVTQANFQDGNLAAHEWGDPIVMNVSTVNLDVDQYRRAQSLIPYMVLIQNNSPLIAQAGTKWGILINQEMNNHIRGKFLTTTSSDAHHVATITTTSSNWGNGAHMTAIANAFRAGSKSFNQRHIPVDGRLAFLSAEIYDLMTEKLVTDKLLLVRGATDDAAIGGVIPQYRGFGLILDSGLAAAHTSSDDRNHDIRFMRAGEGITYAMQLRNVRSFESEKSDGWLVRARIAGGAVYNQPSKTGFAQASIT